MIHFSKKKSNQFCGEFASLIEVGGFADLHRPYKPRAGYQTLYRKKHRPKKGETPI